MKKNDKKGFNEFLLELFNEFEQNATEEEREELQKRVHEKMEIFLKEWKEENKRQDRAWLARLNSGKRYDI